MVSQTKCIDAEHGKPEIKGEEILVASNSIYFRAEVKNVLPTDADFKHFNKGESSKWGNAKCMFSYSIDGKDFIRLGEAFGAKKGKWIGSTVGLFAIRKGATYETGYADVDWFRIEK